MIDVLNETILDLPEAAKLSPFRNHKTGRPAGLASLYRYIQRGARSVNGSRIRLETIRTPGGTRTSREAVERFIRALSNPDAAPAPSSKARKKQIADAESELQAAGFEV